MKIIKSPNSIYKTIAELKQQGKTIGFVPTMGALHAGHISLVKHARKENDIVVVSIFVNPTQFAPNEDLKNYPRPFRKDCEFLRNENTDFLFHPSPEAMYPNKSKTVIHVRKLHKFLCGSFRPSHFDGVTTVIAKLLNIVPATKVYFGQKDYQQSVIIKKMVDDMNIPVRIMVLPIVREKSGLALSSRNRYLSEVEKAEAANLYKSLKLARQMIKDGESNSKTIISEMKSFIKKNIADSKIDYISIVDPDSLNSLKRIDGKAVVALAVKVGKARLIDNIIVSVPAPAPKKEVELGLG